MKRAAARFAFGTLVALSCGSASCAGNRAAAPPPKTTETESLTVDSGGIGSVQTRNDRGETGKLGLSKVAVFAKQTGDLAEVSVEHTFQSDADVPLEGTFRFPMPDGAIVTGLAMMVDGKMIEGELVENEKAKKIYEDIVDAMQDPVLLEWEHGTTFKMRVFPIEPKKAKVVTMRYLVPLRRLEGGAGPFAYMQGTRALDEGDHIPELTVDWNGKRAYGQTNVVRGPTLAFPTEGSPAAAFSESLPDATYTSIRVTPDWSRVQSTKAAPPKNWIVVVDTSRSSLEERKLELQALGAIAKGLPVGSRLAVATSDLDVHVQPSFSPVSDASVAEAVKFVEAVSPDGATDLGNMMTKVGALARKTGDAAVIYLGDCEPSWGVTDALALRKVSSEVLAHVPFYPVVLGQSADVDTAREIATVTGGRVTRARTPDDLKQFAASIGRTPKRLSDVTIEQMPNAVLLPAGKTTLDQGEELTVLVRTEKGVAPPKALTLSATSEGEAITMPISVQSAQAPNVGRRFGAAWVHELERLHKPKDEIVSASKAFSVMSKHTSFLVLDSEEAYAAHNIARRAAAQNGAPRVSGIDGDGAHISLDRIQPGDPEIIVAAPRDAERVVVVLPTGETLNATYDPDARGGQGGWMVRFLVDQSVREGTYNAEALVLLRDGRTERHTVHYTVDKTVPTLDVKVTKAQGRPRGTWQIDVKQLASAKEVDLRRVEVRMPDGAVVELTAVKWGEFRGFWRPSAGMSSSGAVHIVGFDSALNHTEMDVAMPGDAP